MKNEKENTIQSDPVNHPSHYEGKVECIDFITSVLKNTITAEDFPFYRDGETYIESVYYPYFIGTVIKYLWRWNKKGGVEDLKKADWYITHFYNKLLDELKEVYDLETFDNIMKYIFAKKYDYHSGNYFYDVQESIFQGFKNSEVGKDKAEIYAELTFILIIKASCITNLNDVKDFKSCLDMAIKLAEREGAFNTKK